MLNCIAGNLLVILTIVIVNISQSDRYGAVKISTGFGLRDLAFEHLEHCHSAVLLLLHHRPARLRFDLTQCFAFASGVGGLGCVLPCHLSMASRLRRALSPRQGFKDLVARDGDRQRNGDLLRRHIGDGK